MAEPDRTEDGHWIVVGGRRWRASDPDVPDSFRQQLVDELMAARRAVGQAKDGDDDDAEQRARDRVQAAKVALGERGEPWWERTDDGDRERVAAAVLALSEHRAPDKTICPSDAARAVGGEGWRRLMPVAQEVAARLAKRGEVELRQKGEAIDPSKDWKGPIRIARLHRS